MSQNPGIVYTCNCYSLHNYLISRQLVPSQHVTQIDRYSPTFILNFRDILNNGSMLLFSSNAGEFSPIEVSFISREFQHFPERFLSALFRSGLSLSPQLFTPK